MLIANQRAIVPGAVIAVRPVGVLHMQDEAGVDEKIIAVPVSRLTRRYEKVHNYTDLPEITIKQIEHFFAHYKDLEDQQVGEGRSAGATSTRRRRRSSTGWPGRRAERAGPRYLIDSSSTSNTSVPAGAPGRSALSP